MCVSGRVAKTELPGTLDYRSGQFFTSDGLADENSFRLQALGSVCDGKLYGLALLQTAKSVRLDCGEMNENVAPSVCTGDKTVAFAVVEPLDYSLFHVALYLI